MAQSHLENLQVCNAAEALGMRMYARHIADHYKKMAKNNEMPYDLVDIISKTNTGIGRLLVEEIAEAMGAASFEGRMSDPAQLTAYLATNSRLQDTIAEMHIKLQVLADAKNAEHEAYLAREARRQSKEAEALLSPAEREEAKILAREKAGHWRKTQAGLKAKERGKLSWRLWYDRSVRRVVGNGRLRRRACWIDILGLRCQLRKTVQDSICLVK